MLCLIESKTRKARLEKALQAELKKSLPIQDYLKTGNPGGIDNLKIYTERPGKRTGRRLYYAYQLSPTKNDEKCGRAKTAIKRHWNAFGIFDPAAAVQSITVEINIPIEINTGKVSGLFANDPITNKIYLMHTGNITRGRSRIPKSELLRFIGRDLLEIRYNKGIRRGFIIAEFDSPSFFPKIKEFVFLISDLKEQIK